MSSKKINIVNHSPFKYFVIDELLDKNNYIELKQNLINEIDSINFIKQDNLYETIGGGDLNNSENQNKASEFNNSQKQIKSLFNQNKPISNFISYVCSQKFADYLYEKNITDKKNYIVEPFHKLSLFEFFFREKSYVSLKFSQYGTGSHINLHRDNKQKKYAFLFYFGFTDYVQRKSGGTQICKPNIEIKDHEKVNKNSYEIVYDIHPIDNRFAGFKVSDNSWHCVNPIEQLPKGVKRLNLQINYMRCNYYTFPLKIYNKITYFLSKVIKS